MIDAYICDAVRTPIGRYGGALAPVRPDDLAAGVLSALLARNGSMDAAAVDQVVLGCTNQSGEDSRNVARMSALLAGLPVEVPGITVNRLCASGLDAVAMAARMIRCSEADLVLAGGVESMSRAPFVLPKGNTAYARDLTLQDTTLGWRFVNAHFEAMYGADSMAETADKVAARYAIARDDQDAFALRSQQRWYAAQGAGRFTDELVTVRVPKGRKEAIIVDRDEHPRPDTTLDGLARLKGINGSGLTVTAGNASGINDGACAVLVASERAISAHGLTPLARICGAASAGVVPEMMGIGPVPAVQRLMGRLGLSLAQMDVIELNEAFAAQALAVLRLLQLPDDTAHVNPNGGAIAIGHPLGMTGARLLATSCYELRRRMARFALCTMCVGVGQGVAMVIERV